MSQLEMDLPQLRTLFGYTGEPPTHLTVLDVRHFGFEKRLAATCIQGLANRHHPRVFLVFEDRSDRIWLRTYRTRYGVGFSEINDLAELARLVASELNGLVVYDPDMLHSANVAQTYGSLHNLVPVSPALARLLEGVGLEVKEDFRGRWKDRLEAYRWAVRELLPQTNRHLFGSLVVDLKPISPWHQIRDFLVAKRCFVFDLSTRMRDREELALWDEIAKTAEYPGVMLGWHSNRSSEPEYVTRAASHGLSVICSYGAQNLSVHCSMPAPQSLRQKAPRRKAVLQDKVYLTFTFTDGDNIGVMGRFMDGNNYHWLDSARGKVPINWEILPLALHTAPGMVEWYLSKATANDYFIAGPSGWTYTYLSAHKRLDDHLALSNLYGRALDLRSLFVMDWNPRLSFRELEDTSLPERLSSAIENPIGFTHNYAGVIGRPTSTGYIPTVFAGADEDIAYLNSDIYVGHDFDIAGLIQRYTSACDWRPLFISVRVRESTELIEVRQALDLLDSGEYEVVRLDQFFELLREAKAKGLYRTTSISKEQMLVELAKANTPYWWKETCIAAEGLKSYLELDADAILSRINAPKLYFPPSVVGDYVAWEATDVLFRLVRVGLFRLGIYPGLRDKAVQQFLISYAQVEDVGLAEEILTLWQQWEAHPNELTYAQSLARRVIALCDRFACFMVQSSSAT